MKFFGLLNSFTVILLLSNLSCSESDNEPLRKKLKVESSDRPSPNVDNGLSDMNVNNECHDLLTNENLNYFCDLMNKLIEDNHKEFIEYEKAQNDEILKEIKALEQKSCISYKPDCRDDFQTYLNGILDADADLQSLFKKKASYINVIRLLKKERTKDLQFEFISYLLSTLTKSIDTNKNKNLPEVHLIYTELTLINERIKVLRELLKIYVIRVEKNNNSYLHELNYFKLRNDIVCMKELSSNEQNWDLAAINKSVMFKHGVRRFFAKFCEFIEKENKLYFSIFDSMDRIFSIYAAFNELRNNLIRNKDLD